MTVQLKYLNVVPLEPFSKPISSGKNPKATCQRCGLRRTVNHSRASKLCKDCRDPATDPGWHEMMEAAHA